MLDVLQGYSEFLAPPYWLTPTPAVHIFMCSVAAVETTAGIKPKSVKAIRQRQVELGIVAGMTGMDLGSDL